MHTTAGYLAIFLPRAPNTASDNTTSQQHNLRSPHVQPCPPAISPPSYIVAYTSNNPFTGRAVKVQETFDDFDHAEELYNSEKGGSHAYAIFNGLNQAVKSDGWSIPSMGDVRFPKAH